jgi:hypothetical protein
MTLVVDKFRTLLPPRTKTSPSGWLSFNAPCCQHRGHKPDTRKRAGMRFDGEGIVYNCFNCKFTTGWQPGSPFGEKMKSLCRWLGANDDDIKDLVFESLKTESLEYQPDEYKPKIEFADKDLPEGSMPLSEWASIGKEEIDTFLLPIFDYLINRGFDPLSNNFYWSPSPGYENRVIIPFRYQNRIVGSTARKINEGKPKYLSDQHPNFVFNFDNQQDEQKYVFVVEGPFDALSIGGMALLTNDISDQQARIINSLGKEVIVIPDQDAAGLNLIKRAIEYNWNVAFPNWDDDVKDCAEAVNKYGKLFVIVDAIKTAVDGEIKITVAKNNLEKKLSMIIKDEKEKTN